MLEEISLTGQDRVFEKGDLEGRKIQDLDFGGLKFEREKI